MAMQYVDEIAERRMIGLLVAHPLRAQRVLGELDAKHFALVETRYVFGIIIDEHRRSGEIPSEDAILHRAESDGARRDVVRRYQEFIKACVADADPRDLRYYAQALKAASKGRRMIDAINSRGGVLDLLEDNRVEDAQAEVARIARQVEVSDEELLVGSWRQRRRERYDKVVDMQDRSDAYQGILTGIKDVDDRTSGLMPGELGMLVMKTGTGKTSLACWLAHRASLQMRNVCIVTAEVPMIEIEWKLDSIETGVDSDHLRRAFDGRLLRSEEQIWRQRLEAMSQQQRGEIAIIEVQQFTKISTIQALVLDSEREFGTFDLLIVDHLGLVIPSELRSSDGFLDWKSQSIAAIELKFLAKRLKKATWVPVQERGRMSNRERGEMDVDSIGLSYLIPQVGDLVIVARPREEDDGLAVRELEIRVAKGRFGSTGLRTKEVFDYSTCSIVGRMDKSVVDGE